MNSQYEINSNYEFSISVSRRKYDHKPTSADYRAMTFQKTNTSVDELVKMISQGYSVCHIFRGNRRRKQNFEGTHCIFIDVDDSDVEMGDFINAVSMKPTFAHTTFSNGITRGSYRFRLCYIFDRVITTEDLFKHVYNSIVREINLLSTKDNCGSIVTQLMNGNSNPNIETYISYYVYSLSVVQNSPLELYYTSTQTHYSYKEPNCTSDGEQRTAATDGVYDIFHINCSVDNIDRLFAIDDLEVGIHYFLARHHDVILISESLLDYNNYGYAIFPENYYLLPYRITWTETEGKPKAKVKKYKDGEHRRKKLCRDVWMMRLINPNISYLTVLVNLFRRVESYYDNSDGTLTTKVIIDKADYAYNTALNDICINPSKHGVYKVDKDYCRRNNVTARQHARRVKKIINEQSIGEWYDCGLSVSENLKYANDNGIKVSRSTLKRFCANNGISTNPRHIAIGEWYDSALTLHENLRYAQSNNIKVSRSSLYAYCRKNHIPTAGYTVKK